MSTNYYFQFRKPSGMYENIHIGKYNTGWKFTFRGYKESELGPILSFKQWKEIFTRPKKEIAGQIFSEYEQKISWRKFDMFVKQASNCIHSQTEWVKRNYPEGLKDSYYLDEEGNDFCLTEFC